jgi:DNA-binding transcriptional LysR family regulator
MDLGQLQAFVEVAANRSFSRAAEALGLTQPSITARIQSLERDLGEKLFERNGRGVRLTEFGTAFLPHAQRVLQALQDGQDAVRSLRALESGTLRLGAAPTISTYVLPALLKDFHARYPQLEVSLRTEYSDQIAQMVLADEVEVGLERMIAHADVVAVPLYEDEVVLITSPQHRFAKRGIATLEDLSREALLMFNRGSGYYTLVDNALRDAGVLAQPAMELDNMEAAKQMVAEDLGIAILPRAAVEREVQRGELRQVRVHGMKMPRRQITVIYRRGRALSPAAQAFVALLQERFGALKAEPASAVSD